jgi:hypothetical protein
MNPKRYLRNFIRGWLPKEPSLAYARKAPKPRAKLYLKTFSIIAAVIILSGVTFFGVKTYLRYSNPQSDITVSYFEKTINSTTINVGDIVEVRVMVGWHGYVLPEFKREVKITDPFPESYFALLNETNVYESAGYGGTYQLKYTLKAIGEQRVFSTLPQPELYLDNTQIRLTGTPPTVHILP